MSKKCDLIHRNQIYGLLLHFKFSGTLGSCAGCKTQLRQGLTVPVAAPAQASLLTLLASHRAKNKASIYFLIGNNLYFLQGFFNSVSKWNVRRLIFPSNYICITWVPKPINEKAMVLCQILWKSSTYSRGKRVSNPVITHAGGW